MASFFLGRLVQSAVLLFIVSIIGFGVLHLAPGGPLAQFALTPGISQDDLARMAHEMGLDRPLPLQYLEWLSRILSGDWGHSYRDNRPVLEIIAGRLPATLELVASATFLAVILGVWIGVMGAIRRYSVFDMLATVGAMVALSIPTFWFGLIVIYTFSVSLGWLPAGGRATIGGDGSFLDHLHHLVGPALVLTLVEVALWSRYMRSSMLDVIGQDYIRTARAKGLPEREVLWRHAIRNALLPIIALAGVEIPALLSGALVTETVFTWPGMGRLLLDSLGYRDYPVVMGILMVAAVLALAGNLIADITAAVVDPRIRLT
ncbi:ABC transporter permease [Mesorhizobium sp. B2-5-13]|uniref:ABC transporter permease n=1 Tax=unclassified Mesorhizobium TaxID=325217 RepID=UPI0011261F3D|nr:MULTISPECIES: ABC transporter permease [unclassified Mesorhizobium]TPJ81938.1 ABC transporter permease [Mesorhizobium sp. B2-5-13]TPK45875.1 ABC transporter permease [Mesorhizobium sp. B2-5-5]